MPFKSLKRIPQTCNGRRDGTMIFEPSTGALEMSDEFEYDLACIFVDNGYDCTHYADALGGGISGRSAPKLSGIASVGSVWLFSLPPKSTGPLAARKSAMRFSTSGRK